MTLYLDNKAAAFEINTTTVSSAITLLVDGYNRDSLSAVPLPWALTKDLSVLKVIMWAKIKWNYRLLFLLPKNWKSHRQSVNLEGTEGMIHVYTTQSISDEKIEQYIKLSPQIAFAVELTDNGFSSKGQFTGGSSYQLDISNQLKGTLGGSIERNYSSQVAFWRNGSDDRFVNTKGIYLSTKSSRNVALRISSIRK